MSHLESFTSEKFFQKAINNKEIVFLKILLYILMF